MEEQQQNQEPQQQWQYQSGQLEQPAGPTAPPQADSISWSASEFVEHEKSSGWYIVLFGVAIVLAGLTYLLTKAVLSAIVVLLLAVLVAVFGALKPRTLDYMVDSEGIQIGEKRYDYQIFRSFAIIEDAPIPSLQLLPQKRFMVPITIYFDHEQADDIVKMLGNFLPVDHKKRDLVDKFSSRIRF